MQENRWTAQIAYTSYTWLLLSAFVGLNKNVKDFGWHLILYTHVKGTLVLCSDSHLVIIEVYL